MGFCQEISGQDDRAWEVDVPGKDPPVTVTEVVDAITNEKPEISDWEFPVMEYWKWVELDQGLEAKVRDSVS